MELNKMKLLCATVAFCVLMLSITVAYVFSTPYEMKFTADENFMQAIDGLEFNQIQTLNDYSCGKEIHKETTEYNKTPDGLLVLT